MKRTILFGAILFCMTVGFAQTKQATSKEGFNIDTN